MPFFAYYQNLNPVQKRIYRQSAEIAAVKLPRPEKLRPGVERLRTVLEAEEREKIQRLAQRLADGITRQLKVPPVTVRVLAVRPSRDWGELHGLYEPAQGRRRARVSLWMRTAQRRQVVAFRTFLRILLHELCHHLDYELLALPETFHTEGFFKRESSLFRQLVRVRRRRRSDKRRRAV